MTIQEFIDTTAHLPRDTKVYVDGGSWEPDMEATEVVYRARLGTNGDGPYISDVVLIQ